MSFHPEEQRGWSERYSCPYCGSDYFDYVDEDEEEYGVAATYVVHTCVCGCGKRFKAVEVVETVPYGVFKEGEE